MSVYDRQARNIQFGLNCTPRAVGPGRYNLDVLADNRAYVGQRLTPFNHSVAIGSSGDKLEGPGPIYKPKVADINSKHDRTVGGSALANRAERFVYKANDVPGPGTYDIMRKTRWMEKGAVTMDPPTKPPPDPTLVKVFNTDPNREQRPKRETVWKLAAQREVPTIPDRERSFGYSITRDGKLCVNPAPDSYVRMVSGEIPKYKGEDYRGCKFGSRTMRRDIDWAGPSGPPPNSYFPLKPKKQTSFSKTQPLLATSYGMIEAGQPRPGKDNMYSDTPGPDAYNLCFEYSANAEDGNAPFNVGAIRFVYKYNANPGPGTYDQEDYNVGSAPTVASLSFTEPRGGKPPEQTPGPNQYDPPLGVAGEARKRAILIGASHGPFGVTSLRGTASKDEMPAPNAYHLKRALAGPDWKYTRRQTSSFASRTKIGLDPRFNAGYGTPAPNAYKVIESFADVNKPRRPGARTKEGTDRQASFVSYAKRFRDVINKVPAPCTYDPAFCICGPKGRFIVHDEKLKGNQRTPGPGPCYYWPKKGNVAPTTTFNVTLGYGSSK